MGSLAFAGAVSGLGTGIVKNVERQTEEKAQAEDRAHDLQMENMRQTFLRSSQTSEQEFRTEAATTRSEHQIQQAELLEGRTQGRFETTAERNVMMQENRLGAQESMNEADNETRIDVALIGAYTAQSKMTGIKSKGWNIKTEVIQGMDFETGQPTQENVIFANREGSPGTWQQQGGMMILSGTSPDEIKPITDQGQRRFMEDKLMEKLGNKKIEQDFIDKFGYLPVRYMTALSMQSDSGLKSFMEKYRSRQPAYDMNKPQTAAPTAPAPTPAPTPEPTGGLLQQGRVNAQGVPIVDTSAQRLLGQEFSRGGTT